MDENSREGENSKTVENPANDEKPNEENTESFKEKSVIYNAGGGSSGNQVSDHCGSCFEATESVSGPSKSFSSLNTEDANMNVRKTVNVEQDDMRDSSYENQTSYQPHVRMAPDVVEPRPRKPSIGPPPSYSFVMKQKRRAPKPPVPEPEVPDRPPPPNYGGVRGYYTTPEDERMERVCTLPSFAEPIWRSHSQPALCPRCGVLILTTTHSHDSIATHVAALALCLFGCWPCCLLPYCMNVCKNTYHHCPICQSFLGAYTPW